MKFYSYSIDNKNHNDIINTKYEINFIKGGNK